MKARASGLAQALLELAPALEEAFATSRDTARLRSLWQPLLDLPLPEEGLGADAVLALLREQIAAHPLPLRQPGFCGWVTTAAPVVPTAAHLVATVAAPQRWWVHPSNALELIALRWLTQLLGFPQHFGGSFTSGGSVANLLALGAARQHAGERLGFDPAAEGLAGFHQPRIYTSERTHHAIPRALATLGFGRNALRRIPVPRRGSLAASIARAIDADVAAGATPIAVVAAAGDVHMGEIEPLDALREIAHARSLWFHVDGAYGGFGVLDPRVRERFGDLSQIDSFVVDPHKWLAVPVGCGAVFVRDPRLLGRAFALERSPYMTRGRRVQGDPGSCFDELGQGSPERGLEHSSPARGLVVWAALQEIGVQGMRERVSLHLDCARRVAERVRKHDHLELLCEPVLSICCFRYHPPALRNQGQLEKLNRAILAGLRARGHVTPSATRVRNIFALRPCFLSPYTTLETADVLIDEVLTLGERLS